MVACAPRGLRGTSGWLRARLGRASVGGRLRPGRAGGGGPDEGDGEGFGGGAFGVRRPLRFLAYKLELDERQVAELARILDELKTERAQAEVDRRRSLSAFADAVAGDTFDDAQAKQAAGAAGRDRRAAARRGDERARAAARAARQGPARAPGLLDPHRRPVALIKAPSEPLSRDGGRGPGSAAAGRAPGRRRSILTGMSPSPPSFTLQLACDAQAASQGQRAGLRADLHRPHGDRRLGEPSAAGSIRASFPTGRWRSIRRRRCFHYAQEMFDGLKAFRGADGKIRFFRLDRHCQRMHDGAERLCIPPIDEALMREAITGAGARRRRLGAVVARHVALHPADHHRHRAVPGRAPGEALHLLRDRLAGRRATAARRSAPARILVEDKYVRAAAGGLGGVKAGANYIASLRAAEDAKARGYAQVLWTDAVEHTLPRRGRHDEPGGAHRRRVRHAAARRQHPGRRHARLGAHAAARVGLHASTSGRSGWRS